MFVFFGKRRDGLKIPLFDGTGMYQFYKCRDVGTFRLLPVPEGATQLAIEERMLDDLLDGIGQSSALSAALSLRTRSWCAWVPKKSLHARAVAFHSGRCRWK